MYYRVYLISDTTGRFKIGWTKRDPNERLKDLTTGNSYDLTIESVYETKWGPRLEKNLHRRFSSSKRKGEWFDLNKDDVINFEKICKEEEDIIKFVLENNTWVKQSKKFKKYFE